MDTLALDKALSQLANRNGKRAWCEAYGTIVQCELCGTTIYRSGVDRTRDESLQSLASMYEHGITHLKEHNLLAFI